MAFRPRSSRFTKGGPAWPKEGDNPPLKPPLKSPLHSSVTPSVNPPGAVKDGKLAALVRARFNVLGGRSHVSFNSPRACLGVEGLGVEGFGVEDLGVERLGVEGLGESV